MDLVLAGQNDPFHHVLQAWTGRTGAPLPGFPKVIDDFGLTTVPLLANVGATSDVGDTLNLPELISVLALGLTTSRGFDWDVARSSLSAAGVPEQVLENVSPSGAADHDNP